MTQQEAKRFLFVRSGPFSNQEREDIEKKVNFCAKTDIVVRFNNVPPTNRLLFEKKTDYRFIRGYLAHIDRKNNCIQGGFEESPCTKYIAEYLSEDLKSMPITIHDTFGDLMGVLDEEFCMKARWGPSVGFIAWQYLKRKNIYKNAKFILIGFTQTTNDAQMGHDFKKEKEIFRKDPNVEFI